MEFAEGNVLHDCVGGWVGGWSGVAGGCLRGCTHSKATVMGTENAFRRKHPIALDLEDGGTTRMNLGLQCQDFTSQ